MAEQKTDFDIQQDGTFASFETADGDLVIYDRQEPTTWFQSDTVSDVQDWR